MSGVPPPASGTLYTWYSPIHTIYTIYPSAHYIQPQPHTTHTPPPHHRGEGSIPSHYTYTLYTLYIIYTLYIYIYIQRDRKTDRQTDRKTDRHTYIHNTYVVIGSSKLGSHSTWVRRDVVTFDGVGYNPHWNSIVCSGGRHLHQFVPLAIRRFLKWWTILSPIAVRMGDKYKIMRPRAPRMENKWETSAKSCGPEHPE